MVQILEKVIFVSHHIMLIWVVSFYLSAFGLTLYSKIGYSVRNIN